MERCAATAPSRTSLRLSDLPLTLRLGDVACERLVTDLTVIVRAILSVQSFDYHTMQRRSVVVPQEMTYHAEKSFVFGNVIENCHEAYRRERQH